jgi:ectoine hydroxylase-related dioxygenase (phytanoyl-CoA dioxygenase family)
LCRDLIGPSVRLYWDQLVYKRPGTAAEFPWHQDNGYTYVDPQQYLTCWVALTDATQDNGCPCIAPGLHKHGTLRHHWTDLGFDCLGGDPQGMLPLPVPAGSVAVFSSLTPHRTGPNLTSEVRKSYILQYAADGAVVHSRDGKVSAANDPDRQFFVVQDDAA